MVRHAGGAAQVRAGHTDDLPALTELYNHYVRQSPVTFDVEPWTVEQRREQWFAHHPDSGPYRLLVVEADGEVLGYATSSPWRTKAAYARTAETTVYLAPGADGRGLGSLLYDALLPLLREEGLHRLVAGVTVPNAASVALHRKQRFTEVGTFAQVGYKLGRYWDVAWFERSV